MESMIQAGLFPLAEASRGESGLISLLWLFLDVLEDPAQEL